MGVTLCWGTKGGTDTPPADAGCFGAAVCILTAGGASRAAAFWAAAAFFAFLLAGCEIGPTSMIWLCFWAAMEAAACACACATVDAFFLAASSFLAMIADSL